MLKHILSLSALFLALFCVPSDPDVLLTAGLIPCMAVTNSGTLPKGTSLIIAAAGRFVIPSSLSKLFEKLKGIDAHLAFRTLYVDPEFLNSVTGLKEGEISYKKGSIDTFVKSIASSEANGKCKLALAKLVEETEGDTIQLEGILAVLPNPTEGKVEAPSNKPGEVIESPFA